MARTETEQKELQRKLYPSSEWDELREDYRTHMGDEEFSGSVALASGKPFNIYGDLTVSGSAEFRYGVNLLVSDLPTTSGVGDVVYLTKSGSLCWCIGKDGNHLKWRKAGF